MFRFPRLLKWPYGPFILSLIACLALVAGGVVMSEFLHLAACPLCIVQRMLYLLLALVAGVGSVVAQTTARRGAAAVAAVIAATGVFVAGYQVWIQRFATDTNCSANAPWWERFVDWAGEQSPLLFQANGLCSDPAWRFLSLSIAEWSLLAFSFLLALALFAAFRKSPATLLHPHKV